MRYAAPLFALGLLACSGGELDARTTTFASMGPGDDESTEAAGESGDGDGEPGDGDGEPGDGDGDGEPGDGDGEPGDGDGEPGDGDGEAGDGDGEGLCERTLYIHDLDDGTWETLGLDIAWAGANAPPCSVEPKAATYLEPWDQLLVWGADGMFYRRIGVTWQPPEPIAQRWAVLANFEIDSVHYVPPINNNNRCGLTFSSVPTALLYDMYQDGATSYSQSVEMSDQPPPGPPQGSVVRRWAAVQADPALLGNAEWWSGWMGFEDGNLYRFNGGSEWFSWPLNQAPLFANAPGSLDPSKIEAGWGDYALERVYLVGP